MTTVLLYSGGLDSYCLAYLKRPDVLLTVRMGVKYETQEFMARHRLVRDGHLVHGEHIETEALRGLAKYERTGDRILPARNVFLVTLASLYGDKIMLGAVGGDRSNDKDVEFATKSEALLRHVWQPQHWTPGKGIRVELPGYGITKTQLVRMYLDAGGSAQGLLESYSCYEGLARPCGQCKPCLRKWAALVNNKVPLPKWYFKGDPRESPHLLGNMVAIRRGTYRGAEDAELLSAYEATA